MINRLLHASDPLISSFRKNVRYVALCLECSYKFHVVSGLDVWEKVVRNVYLSITTFVKKFMNNTMRRDTQLSEWTMKYWLGKFAFLPTIVEDTAKIPRLFLQFPISKLYLLFVGFSVARSWTKLKTTRPKHCEWRISANARERQTTAKWIIQLFISSMSQHRDNLSRHSHANLIYLIYFSIIFAQCISQYR